ncbi:MAG: hypothetical protein AAFX54_17840 [Pseudomonadota bacterium]
MATENPERAGQRAAEQNQPRNPPKDLSHQERQKWLGDYDHAKNNGSKNS